MPTSMQPTTRQHGARVRTERSRWSPRVSTAVSVGLHALLLLTIAGARVVVSGDVTVPPAVEQLFQVVRPTDPPPIDVRSHPGHSEAIGTAEGEADADAEGDGPLTEGEPDGAILDADPLATTPADAPAAGSTSPDEATLTARDLRDAEVHAATAPLAHDPDHTPPDVSPHEPPTRSRRAADVERPQAASDVTWSEYAHADVPGALDEATRRIGALDAATPSEHREAITAHAPGRPSPELADAPTRSHRPGAPVPKVAPSTRLGDTPAVDATAGGAPRPAAATAEAQPPSPARPTTAAPPRTDSATARLARALSTPSSASPSPSAAATPGLPVPEASGTWAPTAFRVPSAGQSGHASPARPASAPTRPRAPSPDTPRSPEPTPRPHEPVVPETVASAAIAPAAAPTEAEASLSMTDQLRAALGWGKKDEDRTRAPLAQEGSIGGSSAAQGSTRAVLPEEVASDGPAAVSTRATALGRYDAVIEEVVSERWFAMSLPPADAALGVTGRVTVRFHVDRSGRVSGLHVEQPSGFAVLDALALASVPARFPHFPAELDLPGLEQRLVMRWRQAPAVSP